MPPSETINTTRELTFSGGAYIFDCDYERYGIKGCEIVSVHPEERYAVMRFDRGSFQHDVFCNLTGNAISLFEAFDSSPGTENSAKAPTHNSVTARFDPRVLDGRVPSVEYLRHETTGQVAQIITTENEHPDTLNPRPTWNPALCSAWNGDVYEMVLYAGTVYETPQGEFTFFRGVYDTIVKKGGQPGEWVFAKIQGTNIPVNIQIDRMFFPGLGRQRIPSSLLAVRYYENGTYHDGELNVETMEITPRISKSEPPAIKLKTLDGREEVFSLGANGGRSPAGCAEGDV